MDHPPAGERFTVWPDSTTNTMIVRTDVLVGKANAREQARTEDETATTESNNSAAETIYMSDERQRQLFNAAQHASLQTKNRNQCAHERPSQHAPARTERSKTTNIKDRPSDSNKRKTGATQEKKVACERSAADKWSGAYDRFYKRKNEKKIISARMTFSSSEQEQASHVAA